MNFLLDTDTCVFWLRGRPEVRARVAAVGPEAVSISIITLAELRYGAECSANPVANHEAIEGFVGGVNVLPVDEAVARTFATIKATLRRQGSLLEDFDLLLAATALVNGLTLVTNNVSHFARVADLKIDSWALC